MSGIKLLFRSRPILRLVLFTSFFVMVVSVHAQTSAFTFQGRLNDSGVPANGQYDFQFWLFDTLADGTGTQLGTQNAPGVQVTNGVFSVAVDFGPQAFSGGDRYIQVVVRPSFADPSVIATILSPRQRLTSTPYAVRSLSAANADQLAGVDASQYVATGDPRLSDARTPTPGSTDYIQNTTTQQPSTNFNIGGDGIAGGTLSGNVLNAATQFNIHGDRVVGIPGTNVFVGHGTTGASNTSGSGNSFFGYATGVTNTTGSTNSFFGGSAGASNNGSSNSFFGASAGFNNTTGRSNAFIGYLAGGQNTTGIGNTFVGTFAGTSTNGLTNASAIGYAAVVESNNSLVLGSIAGVGGCLPVNNCTDTNVGIGTTSPITRLHVVGDGLFTGNLTVNGNLSLSTINAGIQYNLAGSPIITAPGTNNFFAGQSTGAANTTGSANAFFGPLAGAANTSGSQNAFFGSQAGNQNSTGAGNSFFGAQAGKLNTAGLRNSFFGGNAGLNNTIGGDNAYFGVNAGTSNVSGGFNAMFGNSAGQSNTTSFNSFFGYEAGQFTTTGDSNTFFGQNTGQQNTTGAQNAFFGTQAGAFSNGSNNVFVGTVAGVHNATGSADTMLGDRADVASGALKNATAVGSRAFVSANNSLVLGSISGTNGCTAANNCADTNVGIGTTAPTSKLHVVGDGLFTGNLTVNGTLNANIAPGNANYIQNTSAQQNASFNISGNGVASSLTAQFVTANLYSIGSFRVLSASDTSRTTTLGIGANIASNPTGSNNSYFGYGSGTGTNTGSDNSFFGTVTGFLNTSGSRNSYFGSSAGTNSTSNDNSFFGFQTGLFNTTGFENAFFGSNAGNANTTGADSSFFGTQAGQNNTTGTGNSFIGAGAGSNNTTGQLNTFVGAISGRANATGVNNTTLGIGADLTTDNLINATAIGAHAGVAANNSIVLGGIAGVNSCNFANNCTDTKVGIGITAPTAKLHVIDPTNNGLRVQTNLAGGSVASFGSNGVFQVDSTGTAGGRLHIAENGNVGIGTNAPAAKLVVNGGSIFVTNPSTLIITSPNGACWGITVNDQGALSTFSVPCPQ